MKGSIKALPLGESIFVADRPKGFDLERSLRGATEIWVVTAFAHQTGWNLIREALLTSKADINLICGIDFCQTEPWVLKDWIGRDFAQKKSRAFLYLRPPTFHPKVFLVLGPRSQFALVGSGNLSAGGLHKNVECFSYVSKASAIGQIRAWLKGLVADKKYCFPIDARQIASYERKYTAAAKARKEIEKLTKKTASEMALSGRAAIQEWGAAVRQAKTFMKGKQFASWYPSHRSAARRITRLLHYPGFNFSRNEWVSFYDIKNMGALVHIYKYRVFAREQRLKRALRRLANKTLPIAERIDSAMVWGFGINGVSKILAASDPLTWPVWNSAVRKAVGVFGYTSPHGATPGEKYAAFARLMTDFMKDTKAPNMLALDCFFIAKARDLEN